MESEGSILNTLIDSISPAELKKTKTRMAIAANIADILEVRNISKSKLAELTGKELSVIFKWLSGTHNFTIDTLSKISKCLNIPLDSLCISMEMRLCRSHSNQI